MIGLLFARNGPNERALKAWIAEHMPDLDNELRGLRLDAVRARLNEITGLNVTKGSFIEGGSEMFLSALQIQLADAPKVDASQ